MSTSTPARRPRRGPDPLPVLALLVLAGAWELLVRWAELPAYTLPAPSRIVLTLFEQAGPLAASAWFTLKVTGGALALAAAGGVLLAAVFVTLPVVERALWPLAVALQVTPLVAIAPLILIYLESTTAALLLCAWLVAFFPLLVNTLAGLRAVDPLLLDLFRLQRASAWQRLCLLRLPTALPHLLAGLKIASGLSLIGAVSAEMVAGAAGRETGLASRILEASFRTETPKMFAALLLLVLIGWALHAGFEALARRLLGPAARD